MMNDAAKFSGATMNNGRIAQRVAEMRVHTGTGYTTPIRHGTMSMAPHSLYWIDEAAGTLRPVGLSMPDLVCFSHLRWDFPHQRPHHIMSRCARDRRVFYIEEPIYTTGTSMWLDISQRECGVWVVVPYLSEGITADEAREAQQALLEELFTEFEINNYAFWFYRPAALEIARNMHPIATIYDCIGGTADRDSAAGAPTLEEELLKHSNLVFAAGESIFKSKRNEKGNLYLCANGVDFDHFAQAREIFDDPADQARIPYPRIGYCGVIDERIDFKLLDAMAEARPDWQIVMLGPIVGIDQETLPQRKNIHYLGEKLYDELPAYMAGWEVAMLPFVRSWETSASNPIKIAEYLAAGKPTVSTSINDIVHYYGRKRMVHIADTLAEFIIAAADAGMDEPRDLSDWLERVDHYFVGHTWDRIWSRMKYLMESLTPIGRFASGRNADLVPRPAR